MPDEVLILIDQQKAMEHPLWGPRNNRQAEANILRLLDAWRRRGAPIIHVKHDSTNPNSPFRPGQEGNDLLLAPVFPAFSACFWHRDGTERCINDGSGLGVVVLEQMRVNLQGDGRVLVTEPPGDSGQI